MKTKNKKRFSHRYLNLEKKLPLEKFIPSALLIFLLCVFILSIITYKNIEQYKKYMDWITGTNEVIKKMEFIHMEVIELPLLRRGYIITSDSSYLVSYDSLEKNSKKEIQNLIKMLTDSTNDEKLVMEMDSLLNENIALMRSSFGLRNEFESENKPTNKIQQNLREISDLAERLKNNQLLLLNRRNEKADETNSKTQLFIIITGLFSFFVIGLALLISQRLIRNKNNAEQLLIKSYEELEDIVEERTLELKESNEKLSEEINIRKKNENFLKIQYEVSKILDESQTIEEASKKLLQNICSGINWNFGILWRADEKNKSLNAHTIWSDDENEISYYNSIYDKSYKFPDGDGIAGIVFIEKKSKWVSDLSKDQTFKRKEALEKMGWVSGLGIPISNGKDVIAIIECFNKKSSDDIHDLIDVLESAGRQIGNFIERKKAEENLRISNMELEQNVKERTSELAEALAKIIKEAEEKEIIQNKVKLFAHAIRSIKDCVYITDLENNTIFVNRAFESTYGYTEDEISGREIPILDKRKVTPNLREDILQESLKNGWRGELVTYRKDGTGFYTYLSTSSIRNDEAKAEAIVGICQDITGLKNTEAIIKKRNNLLNLLNDVIHFTNGTFDLNKAIRYTINKVCEYSGWEIGHCFLQENGVLVSSKIWNDNLSDRYSPLKEFTEKLSFKKGEGITGESFEKGTAYWINLNELNKNLYKRYSITQKMDLKTSIWVPIIMGKELTGIVEFFKKDEEPKDQELFDCLINIGLELGSLCEKLDTIDKIRQGEKSLKDAQHIAKLGSWDWDVGKNIVSWSDEMYEVYGLKKNEFDPTFEGFLERVHPDDMQRVKSIILNSLENKSPFSFYHRMITPSGKVKTLKSQGEIYTDQNGKVIRMFGTGHDVTEIREVEEELKKTNAALIETQKELIFNEKLAALGRFSSGIAHEIRNPLANISSLAQLISKADIDEKNRRRLNYIVSNVDIANKIIRNLLSYASPENLEFSYKNLNEIMNNLLESIEARCKSSNIKLIRDISSDLPLMYLDKLKFENAFMNLVSNSIEAMENGGTLTVRVMEDKSCNEIVITFIDTGVGIPEENMDKILEPFFTTKDDGVGLGMGLAYQTIKLHLGKFKIDSIYGKGTAIEIKLPIRK